jgi:hypothetical protein
VRSARCPKKDIILVRVVIFDSCTVYFNWSGNWTQRYNCAARWKNCISDGCFWRVTSVPLYCANLLYLQLKAHTTLFIFLNCSYHIWKLCVKLMCSNLLKKNRSNSWKAYYKNYYLRSPLVAIFTIKKTDICGIGWHVSIFYWRLIPAMEYIRRSSRKSSCGDCCNYFFPTKLR